MKEIRGYEGLYWITEEGEVFNRHGRKLKSALASYRYPQIVLRKNGKNKSKTIHRLVLETYVPNPENKPASNHKDGNKENNHVSNLEWVTHKENHLHACKMGLKAVGEKHHLSKLTEEKVRKIKLMLEERKKLTLEKIAEKYSVHKQTICAINSGKTWKHVN